MSKAAKQSIFILIFLLLGSLGFAGYTIYEKQQLQVAKAQVEQSLQQSQEREQQKETELARLNDQLKTVKSEKDRLENRVKEAQSQAEELQGQLTQLTEDTSRWKERAEKAQAAQAELTAKLDDVNKQLASQNTPSETLAGVTATPTPVDQAAPATTPAEEGAGEVATTAGAGEDKSNDDQYLAGLLKEKASLQVTLENLKSQLSQSSVQMVELKQTNANLQIELDKLKADREELDREIKYKSDLVNNLSLDLARTKNDKKFVGDAVDKLSKENAELRDELKRLVTAKGALEKSVVKLTTDKETVSKKLEQSEDLIQSKIDEIWDIKDNIDNTMQETRKTREDAQGKQIELPPIVVSSGENVVPFDNGEASPGFNGKVVSLNEDNNFVIVDLGESSGVRLGETLSVYRDSKYIARLEVIQVRKDISAADIKDQWSKIQVGDVVK